MRYLIILALCWSLGAATHSVVLTWDDPVNPAGTTYTVYRADGLCSGTPTFASIATDVALKTFTDTTVAPGSYCYAVTAVFNGEESAQSPTADARVSGSVVKGATKGDKVR